METRSSIRRRRKVALPMSTITRSQETVFAGEKRPQTEEEVMSRDRLHVNGQKRNETVSSAVAAERGRNPLRITESATSHSPTRSSGVPPQGQSIPNSSSHGDVVRSQREVIKRLTQDFNDAKKQILKEEERSQAFKELSESRLVEIEVLKKRNRDLENQHEYLKSLTNNTHMESGNDSCKKKRKKGRFGATQKDLKVEQMPLWVFAMENMNNYCHRKVYSVTSFSPTDQKRIWDHDCVVIPAQINTEEEDGSDTEDFGMPLLKTRDGQDAVLKCPMEIALKGNFSSTLTNQSALEWQFLCSYSEDDGLKERYPEKETFCRVAKEVAEILLDQFRAKVASALSGRKREAVDALLRDLGYPVRNQLNRKASDYKTQREKAERVLLQNFGKLCRTKINESGEEVPAFDVYRISSFDEICANSSKGKEPECPEEAQVSSSIPDILFKNNVAKKIYLNWTGFCIGETSSILDLARLDAWIYTWIEVTRDMIRNESTNTCGGTRNRQFNDRFKTYLPQSLEQLLRTCRRELEKLKPGELKKPFHFDERDDAIRRGRVQQYIESIEIDSSFEQALLEGDVFNRAGRCFTKAFMNPENRYDYISLTPEFFKNYICPWIGDVLDCFVGRCESNEVEYREVTGNMVLEEIH